VGGEFDRVGMCPTGAFFFFCGEKVGKNKYDEVRSGVKETKLRE
jgi:hypothetical protein